MPAMPCPCCDQARALHDQLVAGDVDGAIDAGLMAFQPCACADDRVAVVVRAQERLRTAWAARERYRQREARLVRRAAERDAAVARRPGAGALREAEVVADLVSVLKAEVHFEDRCVEPHLGDAGPVLIDLMRLDKKNLSGSLRLILWRGIGHAEIVPDVDIAAIRAVLA